MRCPRLIDLPPPPQGKSGWPWTVESRRLPDVTPSGAEWPAISIVTPSYNQGNFIEETIRSVLLQGYPNLEYVIMDGGSDDQSVAIIQKYADWLTFWQSAKDAGQSAAINDGFRKCKGEIGNWVNSDDFLLINALPTLATAVCLRPEARIYTGGRLVVDEESSPLAMQLQWKERWLEYAFRIPDFPQEASFFRLELLADLGGIDETLFYMMDVDWFQRVLNSGGVVCCIPFGFSALRRQPDMKTVTNSPKRYEEIKQWNSSNYYGGIRRIFTLAKRFRISKLMHRITPHKLLVSCVVVRYDGWRDQWVTEELRS